MPWSPAQITKAILACKKAGVDDDTRKFILRQFANSKFDRQGNATDEPSFTSKRLTNADFDAFMDHIDRRDRDPHHRERWLVQRLANTLELTEGEDGKPLLEPNGVGLQGWIDKRIHGFTGTPASGTTLQQLNAQQLYALIESLKAYGRRHGVQWQDEKRRRRA